MTHLECIDPDTNTQKFYRITVEETTVRVWHGRIGTRGRVVTWTYATSAQAHAEAAQRVDAKRRKGYVEVAGGESAAEQRARRAQQGLDGVPVYCAVHGAEASFGDALVIVGDAEALGAWDPHRGVALNADFYPSWHTWLGIAPGVTVAFKFARITPDGVAHWEAGPNHSYRVPDAGAGHWESRWRDA